MTKHPMLAGHPVSFEAARDVGYQRAVGFGVVDGDTFDAFVDRGYYRYSSFRIRLRGFDAEEKNDADAARRGRAAEAAALLTELTLNKFILVRSYKDTQTFDRWVHDVRVGVWEDVDRTALGQDLAALLRKAGLEKQPK